MTIYRSRLEEEIRELNYQRLRAVDAGREIIDRATAEKRGLSGEEQAAFDRADEDVQRLDRERDQLINSDAARREHEERNEAFARLRPYGDADDRQAQQQRTLREFCRRGSDVSEIYVDLRPSTYLENRREVRGIFGDTGSSGGSLTVPSLVSRDVFQVMNQANVMRQTRMSVITTDHGDPLAVPVATQGAATQIANQDTALAGSDPTLAAVTLRAYGDGNLVAISNDMVHDSGVDILSWVSQNIAIAVATLEEQWLVAGTGSTQPTGIMNSSATGAAGTIATGGSLLLGPAGREVEKLIDVVYSVNNFYRSNAEWIMHNNTTATVRKLRDGAGGTIGGFIWQPSPTVGMVGGEPDRLLGYPVWSSSNVASMASDAKIMAFGDFSRYCMREVRGLRLDRSDDYLFNKDQIALRGKTRVDGALTDVKAINYLHQAVT